MSFARLFRRRRPLPFAEWGWEVHDYHLPADGHVQYAQWLHPSMRPREQPFVVRQAEVDALRQWIRPGDFAVDVGAHGGDTAVPMALAAGPAGCVLALEPNRYAFAVLEANAGLNRDRTHIEPRCYAATNDDGQFEFLYGDASFCNGGQAMGAWNPFRRKYPLQVEGRRLIRVLRGEFAAWLPKWTYLKVDAEGHDLAILASIMPALREWQPVIRTEVFKKLPAADRYELHDLLVEAGYNVFRYAGGEQPQGDPLTRRGMTAQRHFDVLALPRRESVASRLAA